MKLRAVLGGWAVAVLALLAGAGNAQTFSIEPSVPKAKEAVWLVIGNGNSGFFGPSPSTMAGNKISVIYRQPEVVPMPPSGAYYLELGRFPEGAYEVEVLTAIGNGPPQGTIATLQFTVTSPAPGIGSPLGNLTDLWWDPAESGWGLSITHHPSNIIFAVWFVYGADGKPTWYFMSDARQADYTSYAGAVYKTTGPFFGGPFNPAGVSVSPVGTATLRFTQYDRGTFTYTIDGVTGTKNIQRQGF
ncbi:MAG: hypothetical protein AB7P42_23530 [Gammaproteobacteria bacterium]